MTQENEIPQESVVDVWGPTDVVLHLPAGARLTTQGPVYRMPGLDPSAIAAEALRMFQALDPEMVEALAFERLGWGGEDRPVRLAMKVIEEAFVHAAESGEPPQVRGG